MECSFFDEVLRIAGPDYIPIEADVLRARTKTTGIYETRFKMGQLSIQYVSYYTHVTQAWPANRCIVVCLMLAANVVNAKNGFIALRMSLPSFSA